jgi:hypothetical protein
MPTYTTTFKPCILEHDGQLTMITDGESAKRAGEKEVTLASLMQASPGSSDRFTDFFDAWKKGYEAVRDDPRKFEITVTKVFDDGVSDLGCTRSRCG